MDQVNGALHTVGYWLQIALGVMLRVFAAVEAGARVVMTQVGIPANMQGIMLLVIDVLLAVVVVRLFGGFFRILLILLLILLVLHILGSGF